MIEIIFNNLGIKKEDYFLTGSRSLDTDAHIFSNNMSDYDYVVLITSRHIIEGWLKENKIEINYSVYNGGFKFTYEGKLYNIITPIFIEFMAWRESLSILKNLIITDNAYAESLKNKMARYCAYEQLRGIIKEILVMKDLKT
jgi:hypothetical protein